MRHIVTVAWSVGLPVTVVSPAKMARPMKIPFGFWAWVGSRSHVVDWVQISHGKGNFGERGGQIVKYRDAAVSPAKPAEPMEMLFGL